MKLTDAEIRTVEKLRQRQQKFQRRKWFLLIGFGVFMIAYFVLMIVIARFPADGNDMARIIVVAFMEPPLLALFCISTFFFGCVIRKWSGDPTIDLLLRVVDDLRQPTPQTTK